MAEKNPVQNPNDIAEFEFRGETFELSRAAIHSMKVQKALALSGDPTQQERSYWAMDKVCAGNLDEYLDRIPEADGTLGELGCSDEAFREFMAAAAEAVNAKN